MTLSHSPMPNNNNAGLMLLSAAGVGTTELLQVVNNNPNTFQSIVGLVTVLVQLFIMYRQKRIEKKQIQAQTSDELTKTIKTILKDNEQANK